MRIGRAGVPVRVTRGFAAVTLCSRRGEWDVCLFFVGRCEEAIQAAFAATGVAWGRIARACACFLGEGGGAKWSNAPREGT